MRTGKKILSIFLAVLMCLSAMWSGLGVVSHGLAWESNSTESGKCGDNIGYSLFKNEITISGTGTMWNYKKTWNSDWGEYNYSSPFSNRSFKKVTVNNGITAIGDYAFAMAIELIYAFELENVVLPDSIISIGNGAFEGCAGLVNIELGKNIKTIGEKAFRGCWALPKITIPNSVTNIGDSAFESCSDLTDIYFKGTQEQWNAITIGNNNEPLLNANIHFEDNDTPVRTDTDAPTRTDTDAPSTDTDAPSTGLEGKLGETVTYIIYQVEGAVAISGFGKITGSFAESLKRWMYSVDISDNITEIPAELFKNCTNLRKIEIGNNVATVGNSCFEGCTDLASITLPKNLSKIESKAF